MEAIRVGILGATGMVGQNVISLLENHPWFRITHVAASPASAGKPYSEAVAGRWHMDKPLPDTVKKIRVSDANKISDAQGRCDLVFSAIAGDKARVAKLEEDYAAQGFALVSNNSAHRMTEDVPMVIPEINPQHLKIIPIQQRRQGWDKGFIAVKSNCSIQSFMTPVYALIQAGHPVQQICVTTLQALSGAGWPGASAMDMVDNILPLIPGEEEKSETEPLKILGRISDDQILPHEGLQISAHCNRVPVIHGHTACVSLGFENRAPNLDEIKKIWQGFSGLPQAFGLPSAPARPIICLDGPDRPQPRKDRDLDKAMAVSVGRLRPCNLFDIRFVGLHHNTIRGAAGGAILTAELLKAQGYLDER